MRRFVVQLPIMNQLDPEQIRRATLHRDRLRAQDALAGTYGHAILFGPSDFSLPLSRRKQEYEMRVEYAENLKKQLFRNPRRREHTHVFEQLSGENIFIAMQTFEVGVLHVIGTGNTDSVLGFDGWHYWPSFVARDHLKRMVKQHVTGTFSPDISHIPFGSLAVASPSHVIAPIGVELDPAQLGEDEAGAMQALRNSKQIGGFTLHPLLQTGNV